MKINKFGTVSQDQDGDIVINGFDFDSEGAREIDAAQCVYAVVDVLLAHVKDGIRMGNSLNTPPIIAAPDVDYRLLLAKYMEHVGEEEGSTFLGRLQRKGDFYEGRSNKVRFTIAEYEALNMEYELGFAMDALAPTDDNKE